MNVYPNPSDGILKVSNPNNLEGELEVFEMLGRQVLKRNRLPEHIDLSSYARGIYFI